MTPPRQRRQNPQVDTHEGKLGAEPGLATMSTTSYRLFWCYVAVMIGITAAAFGMFLEWEVMRVAGLVNGNMGP